MVTDTGSQQINANDKVMTPAGRDLNSHGDGRTTSLGPTTDQGCLPMCYPLPKWVMGNGFWWMGGLPITLPIQVWVMGNTLPITHFGLIRMGSGWVMTCSTGCGDSPCYM